MPRECLAIIESKSKVRYLCNKPVVAKVSINTSNSGISPDVAELKDMAKALLLDKKSQNQAPATVKAVEESWVTCGGSRYYHNCPATDGNVYRDSIQEFVSQASAVNYNQGNTSYPYQAPAYQAPAPQTQGVLKEDFLAYVKANDAASTSSSGTLPSNTIANPRSDLKAISTRSGVSYDGPQIPPPPSFLPKVVENEPEATKDTVHPTKNGSTEDLQPLVVQTKYPILTSEPVISPTIDPVAFPVTTPRPNQRLSISFVDALILMPKFGLSIKSLLTNNDKLCEFARTSLNEHCSAVLLKKFPEKLGNPGKFLIPCDFPGKAECLALANLGASINLMPLSVWNKLSLPDLSLTCMTLELADRSISHPVGVAEDVYVKVGTFHFLADFVVVDFDADPRVPLILRRSFLKNGRALIDVFEVDYNDMTAKRIDVINMACEEYLQEVLGFSDVITSGNPTPYYDPIVSTTSPTLTPFGNSDFLLEEVDAFLALEDDPTSPERFDESFNEAYDRFKDLLRSCPHHGFSELHQLDTFYIALNSKNQDSLNSAAGVVAKVSTNTYSSGISPDVAELKDMVKALLLDKKSQNQAHATVKGVEESCVTCGGAHSYQNFPDIDGNVYRDNIQEFVSQASAVNYNQ
nr:reverse transcriptase domain-containing protein [Tanacetum cinerariifolium]